MRTSNAPGVFIKEKDLSLRPTLPVGTTVFVAGFAPQGPVDEVLQPATLAEFESIYGSPTNAAERYTYHTIRNTFQSPANVLFTRMAYGSGEGVSFAENYSAQVYPVFPKPTSTALAAHPSLSSVDVTTSTGASAVVSYIAANGWDLSASDTFFIGAPSNIDLSSAQYKKLQQNQVTFPRKAGINYTFSNLDDIESNQGAGLVIVNKRRLTINERFEGYYVGITDNTNLNPATDFDGLKKIKTVNKATGTSVVPSSYVTIPTTRLTFGLTATNTGSVGTVSEVMETVSQYDLQVEDFNDTLTVGVFKLRPSTLEPDTKKLDYVLTDSGVGSLNFFRQKYLQSGGAPTSFFLESELNASPNFKIMINPAISKDGGDWQDSDQIPTKKVRVLTDKNPASETAYLNDTEQATLSAYLTEVKSQVTGLLHAEELYPHGVFKKTQAAAPEVGSIPQKLDKAFELVDNYEIYPIDLALDGGLSTIFVGTSGGVDGATFDDEASFDISDLYQTKQIVATDEMVNYRTITDRFVDFAKNKRKDLLFISDPLRYIFVNGEDVSVEEELRDSTKNFSQHIYWPLRHIYSTTNNSYSCAYGTWGKQYDGGLNRQVWTPFSGVAAAIMANTDADFQPWYAPAGLTRGRVIGLNDLAFYPKMKHIDQLYRINVNSVQNFPNDGFVVWGQKTMLTKPSAFDRINVRRLFLYLETATRSTLKYFVFEPNTLFTRTQVLNVLTPIFELARQTEGLYDYLLVCDERNNTPDVIDRNELVVDIYLKPTRAAEYIVANFYATRTGQDFSELIG